MSIEQPATTHSGYYKRLWKQLYQDIKKAWWENMIAIIIILAGIAVQFRYGWLQTGRDWTTALLNISPYLGFLVLYVGYHALRAPIKLDAESQKQIDVGTGELSKLKADHVTEIQTLKKREKSIRRRLYHRFKKALEALKDELAYIQDERVSITYLAEEPGFIAIKRVAGRDYRVLRVMVTNDGGRSLYTLRAQLKLSVQRTSYENEDLTLMEEGLPIIRQILYRHPQEALPAPRTAFSLSPGEKQFVNVAMQENEGATWGSVTLCLSRIGVDNGSNHVYPKKPIEFSVVVLGGISPYSKDFVLFFDDREILHMKAVD